MTSAADEVEFVSEETLNEAVDRKFKEAVDQGKVIDLTKKESNSDTATTKKRVRSASNDEEEEEGEATKSTKKRCVEQSRRIARVCKTIASPAQPPAPKDD